MSVAELTVKLEALSPEDYSVKNISKAAKNTA